ncbi:MAG: BON domain-containing protein [Thermoanaerobaculia bacterium]
MRAILVPMLTSLALACSGPSPADDGAASAARAELRQAPTRSRELRFEEGLQRLRIRRALLEHLKTAALRIEVEVVGDSVMLSGTVAERSDRALAEEVALSVHSVTDVENQIEVDAAADTSQNPAGAGLDTAERELRDALLEVRVQTRLVRELGQVGFRVEVEATDGVVSLRGPVPDEACKDLAQDSARAVSGVHEVHDLLEVPE